jgi:hypothetical protein
VVDWFRARGQLSAGAVEGLNVDGLLGEQSLGELLLVGRARLQIAHRPSQPLGLREGGLLDPFAGAHHEVLEAEQADH